MPSPRTGPDRLRTETLLAKVPHPWLNPVRRAHEPSCRPPSPLRRGLFPGAVPSPESLCRASERSLVGVPAVPGVRVSCTDSRLSGLSAHLQPRPPQASGKTFHPPVSSFASQGCDVVIFAAPAAATCVSWVLHFKITGRPLVLPLTGGLFNLVAPTAR